MWGHLGAPGGALRQWQGGQLSRPSTREGPAPSPKGPQRAQSAGGLQGSRPLGGVTTPLRPGSGANDRSLRTLQQMQCMGFKADARRQAQAVGPDDPWLSKQRELSGSSQRVPKALGREQPALGRSSGHARTGASLSSAAPPALLEKERRPTSITSLPGNSAAIAKALMRTTASVGDVALETRPSSAARSRWRMASDAATAAVHAQRLQLLSSAGDTGAARASFAALVVANRRQSLSRSSDVSPPRRRPGSFEAGATPNMTPGMKVRKGSKRTSLSELGDGESRVMSGDCLEDDMSPSHISDSPFGVPRGSSAGGMRRLSVGSIGVLPTDQEALEASHAKASSRPQGGKAKSSIADRVGIGPVGALELDQKFQQALRRQWEKKLAAENLTDPLQERQVRQFYDFLWTQESGEEVVEIGKRYAGDSIHNIEAMSALMRRCMPVVDAQRDFLLNEKQASRIEAILERYVVLSHKARVSEDARAVFRPTFCRFLVDSSLVAFEKDRKGRPPYHWAVRLYDSISNPEQAGEADDGQAGSRCATVKQCVALVGQLLGQWDVPGGSSSQVWPLFEGGLQRAESIIEALLKQNKESAMSKAQKVANDSQRADPRELMHQLFEDHGAPPRAFEGAESEWTNGIRDWSKFLESAVNPQTYASVSDCSFAQECHLRDIMIEPEVTHVLLRFSSVLNRLFVAYCDEEHEYSGPPKAANNVLNSGVQKHMTFAAFLRFCLDFSVFPSLCSFEKAWECYHRAEGALTVAAYGSKVKNAILKVDTLSRLKSAVTAMQVSDMASQEAEAGGDAKAGIRTEPLRGAGAKKRLATLVAPKAGGGQAREASGVAGNAEDAKASRSPTARRAPHSPAAGQVAASAGASEPVSPTLRGARRQAGLGAASSAARRKASLQATDEATRKAESQDGAAEAPRASKESASASKESAASSAPAEPAAPPKPELPARVKVYTDLAWLRRPLGQMSPLEVKAFAVVSALCDCCMDRFLPLRALLDLTSRVDDEGFIDARGLLRALDALYITHSIISEEEMSSFIRLIDPHNDGRLDAFTLEKATECVRENRRSRWPDVYGECEDEAMPGGTGGELLGEKARRLSDQSPSSRIFGPTAFAECLLSLGIHHMYGAGVAVKTSMPGGIMALWLVAFLHSRFEHLRDRRETAAQVALLEGSERPPFWRPRAVDLQPRGASQCSTRANTRPSTRGSVGVEGGSRSPPAGTREAGEMSDEPADAEELARGRQWSIAAGSIYAAEPRPPTGDARYSTSLDRLLGEHPGIFTAALAGEDEESKSARAVTGARLMPPKDERSGRRAPAVRLWQMAELPCATCGRVRDACGIGAIFCHDCSGVDDVALAEGSLCRVFERRRLRQEVKALRHLEVGR